MSRRLRVLGTLVLTAGAIAYLAWKIDLGTTLDVLSETSLAWFAAAAAIMVLTVPVLAARWDALLRAHGIHERAPWLTRAYFVAYTAGQLLPTSLGGDAVRIVETARRHAGAHPRSPGRSSWSEGSAAPRPLLLGAVAFLLSIGRYDVSAYLWLEGSSCSGRSSLAFLFFARSARPLLRRAQPLLERVRLARPLRAFYESVHHYRAGRGSCSAVAAVSLVVQAVRVLAIWAAAKAVGIELGVLAYYVMGPLLFLVMLVPFTLNGHRRSRGVLRQLPRQPRRPRRAGVRGRLPLLPRDRAHGAPGRGVLVWEGLRGGARPRVEHG